MPNSVANKCHRARQTTILRTSGILTQAAVGTDLFATTRSAVTSLEALGHAPSVWVFSGRLIGSASISRGTPAACSICVSSRLNTAARKLWGVPVTASTAIAAGTAVLIDTSAVAVDTRSLGVQVKWSESVSDDFEKNMLRVRCEGRFGVSVFQGAGVVKVTLPAAA